jgi:Methyltransferase domain
MTDQQVDPIDDSAAGFDVVWPMADRVGGWMTRDQGRALYEAARGIAADGVIVEIGSHQGRSTVVLAAAAAQVSAHVVAIDPFVGGAMFGGAATRDRFEANLDSAGLRSVVELIDQRSTDVRPTWHRRVAMLYIDGKHDYWTVTDDLRWVQFLNEGAPVLVHDSFSSIGVTLGLLVHVLPTRRLRYVGREGSLARFVVGAPTVRDRLRLAGQLPWFARNVVIKVGLRVARLVGYRGTPDPY